MPLTLPEQDCRTVIVCFEMHLRQLENGEIPNAYDIHVLRDQIKKMKELLGMKECQNTLTTKNLNVNVAAA